VKCVQISSNLSEKEKEEIPNNSGKLPELSERKVRKKIYKKFTFHDTLGWLIPLMAVYYVASKLSIVACSTSCIALRRRNKCANNSGKSPSDEDTKNCGDKWRSKEVSLQSILSEKDVAESFDIKGFLCYNMMAVVLG
jgi:hypothetical protein